MKTTRTTMLVIGLFMVAVAAGPAIGQQKGRGGFGGGFPGFGGAGNQLTALAANEAVQKDLGISGDVSGKLTSLRDDASAARQKEFQMAGIRIQDFQNMSRDERQKLTEKMIEVDRKLSDEFNPKLKQIISADQFKRLEQIQLQYNLRYRGSGALTYANVASELNLTDDQKKKLNDLQTEYDAKQRELFTGGGGGGNQEAFGKLREERTNKTMDLLTAEQKTKLESLKGPAFDVSQIGLGTGRRGKGN
jgi:hypothetical protein